MHNFIKSVLMVGILTFGLTASATAKSKVPVFVSILPQKYFVQQIGKDLVDVQVMVQPGASPATYEPKPRQMANLSKTKIYFAIGVPFEKAWLKKIAATNPGMQVVQTDQGIEKLEMVAHHHHDEHEGHEHHEHEEAGHHGEEKHAHEHAHAHEKDHHEEEHHHHEKDHHEEDHHHEKGKHHEDEHDHHEHTGLDPHIWLSPPLVKIQARSILTALQNADPQNRAVYEANYKTFTAQLERLDNDLKKVFAGKTGLDFMVFHPAWGYFAHAYGVKQVPIEIEGKDPKPAQLKELIKHAKEEGVKVVFVQPQFSTRSAKVVAREIGGQVVFVDPLAEDWMTNLREVANKFQRALK